MSRQSYVKDLAIKVDTSELKELKKQLDALQQEKLEIATKELLELDASDPQNIEKINELREAIDKFTNEVKDVETKDIFKDFKKSLKKIQEDIVDAAKEFFKDIFENALKRIQEMASYDLSNSRIINQEAREQALMYGISDAAQNYALSQAMEDIGATSQEDLMMMNQPQRELFAERIGYYTQKYNDLANKDFFKTIQEFTQEWKNFKIDMEFALIDLFMQNKDLIIDVMNQGIEFMQTTLVVMNAILSVMQEGRTTSERDAALNTIMSSYSNQQITNNNVSISNTLNSSQALGNKEMLDKASEMSYAQIIKILER